MPAALDARTAGQPVPTFAELIVLEEIERGAAGARMHDGPVQDLLATRYLTDLALSAAAKGADAEALRTRLESIREAAVLALAGSRAMMSELTARATNGLGLAGALRSGAATVSPGATVQTGSPEDQELGELPPAVAVSIHRLASALLRVCESPAPTLSVRREGGNLRLTLDAPVDLDHPEVVGSLVRVSALGGAVSTGDGGVLAVVPLDSSPHDRTPDPAPEGQS